MTDGIPLLADGRNDVSDRTPLLANGRNDVTDMPTQKTGRMGGQT